MKNSIFKMIMNINKILLIWEIPLAFFSFLFYKLMKFVIGNLYTIYLAINQDKAKQWRILSAETLKTPLSLPVLMTKGPRWNTHAIIGTLGPLSVQETIALDLNSIKASAQSSIGAVYSFPNYQTVATIGADVVENEQQWQVLNLKPGKYTLGLRYYNYGNKITFPDVKIDGQDCVKAQDIPNNVNEFYQNLIQEKNWFYSALHYYIYTLLKSRKWLPESFVRGEYLPVGAPDTQFFYHYLSKNSQLEIQIDNSVLEQFDVYFTLYDRCSLPLSWCHIQEEKYLTILMVNNGYYLLRVRNKSTLISEEKSVKFELIEQEITRQKLIIS